MLDPGSEICGFEIEALIGLGGMAEVYQARQLAFDRTVALKVFSTSLAADEQSRERFRREGKRQAALDHPNVVTVYEAGVFDDGLFLAMRLVRGRTLKALVADGALEPRRALALLTPIAAALDAAHSLGLIHRDVKPQNILVDENDYPFLSDFGVTRDTHDTGLTRTGQIIGTIDYIAPEILHGAPASPACDVYALGAVLYECLTGSVPYPRDTEASVLYAHAHEPPPTPTAVDGTLPAAIDAVVGEAMAKEPADRPQTAVAVMAAAAEAFAPGGPRAARVRGRTAADARDFVLRPRAPTAPARPWREPRAFAGIAAGVLLILGLLAFTVGHRGSATAALEPLATTASSAAISLSAPAGWTRIPRGVAVPGLTLGEPISMRAPDPGAGGVVAAVVDGAGPTLLPVALRRAIAGSTPTAEAVRLGRSQALRYAPVRVAGFDGTVRLHAVALDEDTVILACYAPAQQMVRFDAVCGRIAGSLAIMGGPARPLGGDAAAVRRLQSAVAKLGRSRRAGRAELRDARTSAGQAVIASRLGDAARVAATSVGRAGGGPAAAPGREAASAALRAVADGYRRLSRAARAEDRRRYVLSRQRVTRAETSAIARLRALVARLSTGVGPL